LSANSNRSEQELWELFNEFEDALVTGRPTADLEQEATRRFGTEGQDLLQTLRSLQSLKSSSPPDRWDPPSVDDIAGTSSEFRDGRFGRFRILRTLGYGGNGIVYHAFDPAVQREVALKLPRAELVMDGDAERRFLHEARAAAALEHVNIVPVHEAGHVGALEYIASAYCSGPDLRTWLRRRSDEARPVAPKLAACWIRDLARAVHYAHTRGIVHRDIKPGNILLDPDLAASSVESAFAVEYVPRLTDFGVAKWLDDKSERTTTGVVVGTIAYMAPERALGPSQQSSGTSSDIYSLGAVLYELLAGRPPVLGETTVAMLRQIETQDPEPPSRINRDVPAELEAICLKCLERRPQQRYATAEELAEDLTRFLGELPTIARPLGRLGRGLKWGKRHPTRAALSVALMITFVMLSAGGWWYSRQLQSALDAATRAQRDAVQSRQLAVRETGRAQDYAEGLRRRVYPTDVRLAQQSIILGDRARAQELLEAYRPAATEEDLREFGWHHLWSLCAAEIHSLQTGQGEVYFVCFTPDGKQLVTSGEDGTVKFWDPQDWTPLRTLEAHTSCVNSLSFSPDGRFFVTGSCDRTIGLWDLETLDPVTRIENEGSKVSSVMFTPDGRHFVSSDFEDTNFRLWDRRTGKSVATISFAKEGSGAVAFLNDTRHILSSAGDGLRIHDIADGLKEVRRVVDDHLVRTAALSPDKSRLAWAASDFVPRRGDGLEIYVDRLDANGAPQGPLQLTGNRAPVFALAFSPDGKLLASGSDEGTVRLWDSDTGDLLATYPGHQQRVSSIAFSPDGNQIYSASHDGTVRVWASSGQPSRLRVSIPLTETNPTMVFTEDDSRLILAGREGVQAWDTSSWSNVPLPESPSWEYPNVLSCSRGPGPQGCTIAVAHGPTTSVWTDWTRLPQHVLDIGRTSNLALSADGRWLAASRYSDVGLWNLDRPEAIVLRGTTSITPTPPVAVAPHGLTLASGDGSRPDLFLWKPQPAGEDTLPSDTFSGHTLLVDAVQFSADGRFIATASRDGSARVWNLESGREQATFFEHRGAVLAVALAPAGETVATGGEDASVRLWDPGTGIELLELRGHRAPVIDVAFSTDGTKLAGLSRTDDGRGQITVWHAPRQ